MGIQKYMSFVKAVEYGSFSKAGEKLSYSQSIHTLASEHYL